MIFLIMLQAAESAASAVDSAGSARPRPMA
jgi:hypothetical protein